MGLTKFRVVRTLLFFGPLAFFLGAMTVQSALGQTVRVDITPGLATSFDPDKALGSSMDILPANQIDRVYSDEIVKESLSAGWGPISYRQNTELTIDAWHWNPNGTWSDAAHQSGYFAGSVDLKEPIRQSFGYALPHRGSTRSDAGDREFSRITDGDSATYWKSNPYLAKKFTGEDDWKLPQWVVLDFGAMVDIDAIQIDWANPYARKYLVQYWVGQDAINRPASGMWTLFPSGDVQEGTGGSKLQKLADSPVRTRFVRVWMTESSNTCDTHGGDDPRNCVGYAINEISAGNFAGGKFVDLVVHARGQNQTAVQVSSTDSWHTAADVISNHVQTGFDLFYTSGITNHLPAMIPISMVYANPEDAAAEIAYVEKRGYPISYVEMGEEPDGQYMLPEDYAALYLQFAKALHRVDPNLKLGGPIFTGVNEDIQSWPDAKGRTSWLGRFIDYLKEHGRLDDLKFVSYEHYPFAPCEITWADLYREADLVQHIAQVWREDGVPSNVPLMITESNVSWALTQPMADNFAALWLADNAGSFLATAGPGGVFYHSPIQPEPLRPGCHGYSTYGNFVANEKLEVLQHTSQYFASQMINLEWVKHGAGVHQLFPAASDVKDDAGHTLVTVYAVKRPGGEWSLMLINKDPTNAHDVNIEFVNSAAKQVAHFGGATTFVTFGAEQYIWHPDGQKSHADPDGPALKKDLNIKSGEAITLPKASVTVVRGGIS
jgi:hypothetical protein